MTMPVSQSVLGFTGGVLASASVYGILSNQLRQDTQSFERTLQAFRRTIEYGLPLLARDEEFLQTMNILAIPRRRRREPTMWGKVKRAAQWNWNAGLAGAVASFHEWRQSP